MGDRANGLVVAVVVAGFHHARGPEIEFVHPASAAAATGEWNLLPFMALPDGAHMNDEDFSYFTIRNHLYTGPEGPEAPSLFGLSCSRQLRSSDLKLRPADVTRSTIQKSIIVLFRAPVAGPVRDKLGVVTHVYFEQRDFDNREILVSFYDSLVDMFSRGLQTDDLRLGIPLRELVHRFRHDTLVLVKALLLGTKILFYGSKTESLCMVQYSLLSLVPGLLNALDDCCDPEFDTLDHKAERSVSLQSSNHESVLRFFGFPLHLFSRGAFFGPYTPLQRVDTVDAADTRAFMIGCTNSLFYQQRAKHAQVSVDVDHATVTVMDPALKPLLKLSAPDRSWATEIITAVDKSWSAALDNNQTGAAVFSGSDEYIYGQFERYLLALCAAVRYDEYLSTAAQPLPTAPSTTLPDFNSEWVSAWQESRGFAEWTRLAHFELFDIIEPRHPVSQRPFTLEDFGQRVQQQVQDLKLDERAARTRGAFRRGGQRIQSAWQGLWTEKEASPQSNDIEERMEETREEPESKTKKTGWNAKAYVSSWSSWAAGKRGSAGKARPAEMGDMAETERSAWAEDKSQGNEAGSLEETRSRDAPRVDEPRADGPGAGEPRADEPVRELPPIDLVEAKEGQKAEEERASHVAPKEETNAEQETAEQETAEQESTEQAATEQAATQQETTEDETKDKEARDGETKDRSAGEY